VSTSAELFGRGPPRVNSPCNYGTRLCDEQVTIGTKDQEPR